MDPCKRSVVLVGHGHTARRLLQLALNLAGYGVYVAESSWQARKLIDEVWPQAVVLDVGGDPDDTLGLAREIRGSLHRRMVIVASAAVRYAEHERAAYEAGCDAFVLQPGETRELTDLLEVYLPGTPVDAEERAATERLRWN